MKIDKGTWPLFSGFLLIFAVFIADEKYGIPYFDAQGDLILGLLILLLGYTLLFLGDLFFSPWVISRIGTKKSIVLGGLTYFLLSIVIPTQNMGLIIPASALAGLGAALVWNGMSSHLIFSSEGDGEKITNSIGLVLIGFGLGAGVGLIAFSLLTDHFGMQLSFWLISPLALLGITAFCWIGSTKEISSIRVGAVWRTLSNRPMLRLSTLSITTFMVFGVLSTQIPLEIGRSLGPEWVGYLTASAYLTVATCLAIPRLQKVRINTAYLLAMAGFSLLIAADWLGDLWLLGLGTAVLCLSVGPLFVTMLSMSSLAKKDDRVLIAQAIFTSADDLTIAMVAGLSIALELNGIPWSVLYYVGLGVTMASYFLLRDLLSDGRLGEKAEQAMSDAWV